MDLHVIILAAGQGTRMRSERPKVLHPIGGRPMLAHVLDTARALRPAAIHVIYGHGGGQVREALEAPDIQWVEQAEQLGTGHAVARALPGIPDGVQVLVLYGDVPLIGVDTLGRLCRRMPLHGVALLTAELADPAGYGRILRNAGGQVIGIVEQKDASPEELAIREINTGFMSAPAAELRRWVAELGNDNAQGEYYLTDVIAAAVADGGSVESARPASRHEIEGINNRWQLAQLERVFQRSQAERLALAGVSLADPARLDLRGRLQHGRDVELDVNLVLEGEIRLGDRVRIGPGCVLRNVELGDDVEILAYSVIEDAVIGAGSRIGPFARIRPETRLAEQVHVGNFVEVKKSAIGAGSKVNHLSYIGDTRIGERVNIGAGTITCNYDGANKHLTVIGDDAFIGSDTQLVAPVTIGARATIGAGSTITRDAPAGELTLSRVKQTTRAGWQRPTKKAPT